MELIYKSATLKIIYGRMINDAFSIISDGSSASTCFHPHKKGSIRPNQPYASQSFLFK